MEGEAVAWFEIQCVDDDSFEIHSCIEICGNEQFYLGRDTELCRYAWPDEVTISRQHLRVHCILYEQDPDCRIAPLVYATDLSFNGTYLKKKNMEPTASPGVGISMGQNSTFLLDDGDELRISDRVSLVYHSMNDLNEVEFTPIQERERNVFAAQYLLTGRLLGEGGYGKVLIAINQKTQRQLACKMVKLNHLYKTLPVPNLRLPSEEHEKSGECKKKSRWPVRVAACFREFDILRDLNHPNIVALEKVFWSHNTIFIFQELVTGGDLFSFLQYKGGRLSSIQSAVIIRQVLKAVEYLHDRNIVHRDIKPDNILMTSLEDGARVVLTDFGNAKASTGKNGATGQATNRSQRMFSCVGTLEFAAPEIHRANKAIPAEEGYSKSVDMWSVGSVTASILGGKAIFADHNDPRYDEDPHTLIVGATALCDLRVLDDIHHPIWSAVGERPKDFIRRLLVLEEQGRMTASAALVHPWFGNELHAGDYEKLYQRSIDDWEPRQPNVKLVERISRPVPDLTRLCSTHESMSRFFVHSQSDPTHNMLQKLSDTHTWRVNTPLPGITEDYEHEMPANQARASSPMTNNDQLECQHYNFEECHQYDRQASSARNNDNSKTQLTDKDSIEYVQRSRRSDSFVGDPMNLSSLANATRQGMYSANDPIEYHGSHDTQESMHHVTIDSLQQKQPQVSEEMQGLTLVFETPLTEQLKLQDTGNGEDADDSYQQTQFPEECAQRQDLSNGQDSILVRETPPKVFKKHSRTFDVETSTCRDSLTEDRQEPRCDVSNDKKATKRLRLSRFYH